MIFTLHNQAFLHCSVLQKSESEVMSEGFLSIPTSFPQTKGISYKEPEHPKGR